MNHDELLLVFVGMTGFALLVQAIVMLVAFFTVRKSIASVLTEVSELRASVTPILTKSKDLLDRLGPKAESIATDLAELAHTLRVQGAEIQSSVDELMERIHQQTLRVDAMFTNVLDGVEHASTVVAESVSRPARQISAIISSAKAFLTVLATGRPPSRPARTRADQDMFV